MTLRDYLRRCGYERDGEDAFDLALTEVREQALEAFFRRVSEPVQDEAPG